MNMEHRGIKHQVTFREPQIFSMPGGTNGCGKGLRFRMTVGKGQS